MGLLLFARQAPRYFSAPWPSTDVLMPASRAWFDHACEGDAMNRMLTIAAALLCASQAAAASEGALVAIRAARMLDVRAGRMIERPVLLVRGEKIERLATDVPAGARVIDLGDRT